MPATAVDVLLAKDEIRDVLARYCRAVDRFDADLLRTVYHPDAIDEHGLPDEDGSAVWFQEHVFSVIDASWESTQHFLGNCLIDVRGERADAETYVVATHVRRPDVSGARMSDVVGARYVDQLDRRDGVWRISHRIVAVDWMESRPFRPVTPEREHGRHGRKDIIYRAPDLARDLLWAEKSS